MYVYVTFKLLQGSWEKKLIDRVHNTRDRKRSGTNDGLTTPPAKRGQPRVLTVLSRYPPLSMEGDIDVERNEQAISQEIGRETPRKDILLPLLRQTFTSRREYILSDSDSTIAVILQKYPALAFRSVVSHLLVHDFTWTSPFVCTSKPPLLFVLP